jgi:hypothetical protein
LKALILALHSWKLQFSVTTYNKAGKKNPNLLSETTKEIKNIHVCFGSVFNTIRENKYTTSNTKSSAETTYA